MMPARPVAALPIDEALPALVEALAGSAAAVLQAPPGAGKTTRVPLALIDEPWLAGGKILMLEPRRLATRAAARRMAETLGEEVGRTVGYRMRLESRVSRETRIEVVTEGVLIRLLQEDLALDGVGAVIFDEFHERSLDADLGLALCLEIRRELRPDLRLLAMSATLDGEAVARLLGDAPVVSSAGRMFPVKTRWAEGEGAGLDTLPREVASAVRRALAADEGDVLAFLPGAREIRRAARLLEEAGTGGARVLPLYGDLPPGEQDAALRPPAPGERKVVLATTIAETSLTIPGIRIVVDGGFTRAPRFDPRTGMTRLDTVRVSQAAADQRRGRAGREAPGVCWRLWSEATHRALRPQSPAEILDADLAPLALTLAEWGASDPARLAFLDPPPPGAYAQASLLLRRLDALDADGRITPHGRALARLGLHPRLGHMLVRAREAGEGATAAAIAGLLGERDMMRGGGARDADLRTRLELLAERRPARGAAVDEAVRRRAGEAARMWRQRLGFRDAELRPEAAGRLLALAYPDRIAQRRPDGGDGGRFVLSNGGGAVLPATDPLAARDFLAVAELDGERQGARIFLAAPLDRAELETLFAGRIEREEIVSWDRRAEAVAARRRLRLGALVLKDDKLPDPPAEKVAEAMLQGIRELGLSALPWNREAESVRARAQFLRRAEGEAAGWPDLSDEALLAGLEEWLGPYLGGVTRRTQLDRIDLAAALKARLDWPRLQRLDAAAPTHVEVPSGSRIAIDYAGEEPVLAVKLQEMFGAEDTPRVAGGKVPLLIHLLSPAGRPLQVTRDLAGFWRGGYAAVRAEMRGRYPRHPWPDDPLSAVPTKRTKARVGG